MNNEIKIKHGRTGSTIFYEVPEEFKQINRVSTDMVVEHLISSKTSPETIYHRPGDIWLGKFTPEFKITKKEKTSSNGTLNNTSILLGITKEDIKIASINGVSYITKYSLKKLQKQIEKELKRQRAVEV